MAPRSFLLSDALVAYVEAHGEPRDPVAARLAERTAALPQGGMQVSVDEGNLLTVLARLVGATNAVEVGTFTGYSALCLARGLAEGGRLLCCDVSEEWTAVARETWAEAGVEDRIELRLAPAIDTLRALPADPAVDLAFIDADKVGYLDYYEELVPRLRPGGLLLADNTLWSGQVADPDDASESTEALRAFNRRAADDPRVFTVLVPVADGLTICLKH